MMESQLRPPTFTSKVQRANHYITDYTSTLTLWRGTGGSNPGVMGAGSVREMGKERAEAGNPRGQEPGEMGNKFCNIVQFVAIEKAHRGGKK